MAGEAVLKYLVDTNRPYSCADVTVNLRGAFPKSAIQKALDALSESGKIKCKLYGKQKVYAAIQPENVEGDQDNEDYDALVKTLVQNITENTAILKASEATLKNIMAAPKTDKAKAEINDIQERIEAITNKLETLKNTTQILSKEEKESIMSKHEKLLKEYRNRKRICSDIVEAVMEGYNKPKKILLEELCVETDEMANFKLMSA